MYKTTYMTTYIRGTFKYCAWLFAAPFACAAAALDLQGEFTQGGLVRGQVAPGTSVHLDGRQLRVSSDGAFVFGLGYDAPARVTLLIEPPASQPSRKVLDILARDYRVQYIHRLDEGKVTPTREDLERIRRENARIARARVRDDERTDFLGEFVWPVHGPITGVYGSRRVLNGRSRRPHFGVDVACQPGTPVKAPAPGVVTFTHDDMFFSGGTLVIDHGHGVSSSFLHLKKILVAEGERVEQGKIVAEVGASGRVTGAHLDWRINWFKQRIDPVLVVGEMPKEATPCSN